MNDSVDTQLNLFPSLILEDTSSPTANTTEPESGELNWVAKITLGFMIVSTIFIVLGNTLVLITVFAFSALRDISSIFIANLAIADLITGLSQPFQMAFFFYPSLEQNKQACILRYSTIVFACNASVYSLVCTVTDRFLAIAYPFRYNQLVTEQRVYIVIIVIWIMDFVFCLLPSVALNNFEQSPFCLYEFVISPVFRRMNHSISIALAVVMFLIYVRIFFIARGHAKRIQTEETQYGANNTPFKRQSYVITALVVLFFQISWLPLSFVQLTMYGPNDVTELKVIIANFCVFFGILNSMVNPVIYAWKNRQYRRAFVKILRLKLKDDFTISSTETA